MKSLVRLCARFKEFGLGIELTWDARQLASLEAKVLESKYPIGLGSIWQENRDKIKDDSDF